jgi:hypothetical protein
MMSADARQGTVIRCRLADGLITLELRGPGAVEIPGPQAMLRRIVDAHGARVETVAEQGKTVLRVVFPAAEDAR